MRTTSARHSSTKSPSNPAAPPQPQAPKQLAQPAQQVVHLNWSHFKPEFSGKPEEDAESHLLHTNDWMNAHYFVEDTIVQRLCLTLLGEARLWYHSLECINDKVCKISFGNSTQR